MPEVARNMSLQEGKLTGIASDLKRMLDKYHLAIDGLREAEEELMIPELQETQKALNPGHSRLTWLVFWSLQCDQMARLLPTFGHLLQWKLSQWHTKFAKIGPKFSLIGNKSSKRAKFRQIWSHWFLIKKDYSLGNKCKHLISDFLLWSNFDHNFPVECKKSCYYAN